MKFCGIRDPFSFGVETGNYGGGTTKGCALPRASKAKKKGHIVQKNILLSIHLSLLLFNNTFSMLKLAWVKAEKGSMFCIPFHKSKSEVNY